MGPLVSEIQYTMPFWRDQNSKTVLILDLFCVVLAARNVHGVLLQKLGINNPERFGSYLELSDIQKFRQHHAKNKTTFWLWEGSLMVCRSESWTFEANADELDRNIEVVKSILADLEGYCTKKRPGSSKSLLEFEKRCVVREARSSGYGFSMLKRTLWLTASARTIRRCSKGNLNINHKKNKIALILLSVHKTNRVKRATMSLKNCKIGIKWRGLTRVLSDEKRITLDGPDGLACYWHDLKNEPLNFAKPHTSGGGTMVRRAFCGTKTSELVFIDVTPDASRCRRIIQETLLPMADELPLTWIFLQDGAQYHRVFIIKGRLQNERISVMEWLAYSPDLNSVENPRRLTVRKVYVNSRQLFGHEEPCKAIQNGWDSIDDQTMIKLRKSMRKRCIGLLRIDGYMLEYYQTVLSAVRTPRE